MIGWKQAASSGWISHPWITAYQASTTGNNSTSPLGQKEVNPNISTVFHVHRNRADIGFRKHPPAPPHMPEVNNENASIIIVQDLRNDRCL